MKPANRNFLVFLAIAILGAAALGREYDAETDIGIVAESSAAANQNTVTLNDALRAQWPGGKFKFADGHTGPVLDEISFAAKEFDFAPGVETSHRTGGGFHGVAGRNWVLASAAYDPSADGLEGRPTGQGGLITRFVMIVDPAHPDVSFVKIFANGFTIHGGQVSGRPYILDPTGEGPDPVGGPEDKHPEPWPPAPRCKTAIEFAGGGSPALSLGYIHDLTIHDFQYGVLTTGNDNADTFGLERVTFKHCDSDLRLENPQSCAIWLRDCSQAFWGGRGLKPVVVVDAAEGGDVYIDGLSVNHPQTTIYRVKKWTPNTSALVAQNLRWDQGKPTKGNYLTLFEYIGPQNSESRKYKWSLAGSFWPNNYEQLGTTDWSHLYRTNGVQLDKSAMKQMRGPTK